MSFSFNNSYARLAPAFFAKLDPSPVKEPKWIAFNRELSAELGLDPDTWESEDGLSYLSGNEIAPGSEPLAMAYAGHQFGGFVPQLGDGRAILLGEVIDRNGNRRDIQLKGSGPTPFSRRGDGRSALGPVLREYLVSEAMAAMGIPTTRALAAIWSGESVWREEKAPGGVFTRVASSHLRVGTVEYFSARGDEAALRELVRYAVARHDPEAVEAADPAFRLLDGVGKRQASLVARWMGVGFIHGVMNTDNTSLSGETIDYGPCAFLDTYDPEKVFSSIDRYGRYAYQNQGPIAQWNLARLAEALMPVLIGESNGDEEAAVAQANEIISSFEAKFTEALNDVFARKVGFEKSDGIVEGLSGKLLEAMHEAGSDFTITFRQLSSSLDSEAAHVEFGNQFREKDSI
ncbi:MAG: YdiU family protein, partial [Verrucomicrobiota bacterium]